MTASSALSRVAFAFVLALAVAGTAHAVDIGQVKVSKGDVAIERAGQTADPPTGRRGGSERSRHRPAHRVVVIPETRVLSPMPNADHLSHLNVA